MYGLLTTVTGKLEHEIRNEVTLSDYNRLVSYWTKFPPTHVLVRALFDFDSSSAGTSRRSIPRDQPTYATESWESFTSRWAAAGGAMGH